jgi:lipopolysaccharide export system permease protein
VAIAAFSFTLMGLAFGISISRNASNRGVLFVIILGALFLIAFFVASSFDHALLSSTLFYLMPHFVIIVASLYMLRRTARGIE